MNDFLAGVWPVSVGLLPSFALAGYAWHRWRPSASYRSPLLLTAAALFTGAVIYTVLAISWGSSFDGMVVVYAGLVAGLTVGPAALGARYLVQRLQNRLLVMPAAIFIGELCVPGAMVALLMVSCWAFGDCL